MTNIINDISTLTTIPVKTWNKLVKKTNYCICDAVLENTLIDEDITAVDLGIGVLYIKRADLEGNIIKYRLTVKRLTLYQESEQFYHSIFRQ